MSFRFRGVGGTWWRSLTNAVARDGSGNLFDIPSTADQEDLKLLSSIQPVLPVDVSQLDLDPTIPPLLVSTRSFDKTPPWAGQARLQLATLPLYDYASIQSLLTGLYGNSLPGFHPVGQILQLSLGFFRADLNSPGETPAQIPGRLREYPLTGFDPGRCNLRMTDGIITLPLTTQINPDPPSSHLTLAEAVFTPPFVSAIGARSADAVPNVQAGYTQSSDNANLMVSLDSTLILYPSPGATPFPSELLTGYSGYLDNMIT